MILDSNSNIRDYLDLADSWSEIQVNNIAKTAEDVTLVVSTLMHSKVKTDLFKCLAFAEQETS